MKKKLLPGAFAVALVVFAIGLLISKSSFSSRYESEEVVSEQECEIEEPESSGESMLWESLSRHFISIN